MMEIPEYKEFHNFVRPVIRKDLCKVQVVTIYKDCDEITTLLNSQELRRLADYLDYIKREIKDGM